MGAHASANGACGDTLLGVQRPSPIIPVPLTATLLPVVSTTGDNSGATAPGSAGGGRLDRGQVLRAHVVADLRRDRLLLHQVHVPLRQKDGKYSPLRPIIGRLLDIYLKPLLGRFAHYFCSEVCFSQRFMCNPRVVTECQWGYVVNFRSYCCYVVALRPFSGDRYPACIRAPHTLACRQVYVVNNTKYNQMGAIVTD